MSYVFRLFFFLYVFRPSFFSFSYLFAAVIDLLPDLLPLQKILRKHSWDGQLWVCQSNFWALSCIFQASLSQSHLTWVSLERFFLLQKLSVDTMMPILVKDDDIRSGTKAKAKCKKVVDEAPCTEKACCFSLDSSHCWKNVLVLNTCRYILFNNYSSISGYFQMLLQIHWVPCGLLLASWLRPLSFSWSFSL